MEPQPQILNKYSIDVIVPVYNGEKYIKEALQSIEEQTYSPKTIFVVDDASHDGTKKVVEDYAKNCKIKIEYSRLDENVGPSKVRNIGIKKSTAEYVAFLDADDLWEKEKLEKQIEIFKNSTDPKLGVVYCKYCYIDKYANRIYTTGEGEMFYAKGNLEKEIIISHAMPYSHCQILVPKTYMEMIGLFDENLRAGEDTDLLIRLSKKFHFDYPDGVLLKVRKHENNTTKNRLYMANNLLKLREKYEDKIDAAKRFPEDLMYWSYKEKLNGEITDFIRNLPPETKSDLFPITRGNIKLAILLYSPKWAFKYIVKKFSQLLSRRQTSG